MEQRFSVRRARLADLDRILTVERAGFGEWPCAYRNWRCSRRWRLGFGSCISFIATAQFGFEAGSRQGLSPMADR